MRKLLLGIFFIAGLSAMAYAQSQKTHEKGSYVDSTHRYYQQAELPLYVYVSHKPDIKPTQLPLKTKDSPTGVSLEKIYLDGHGVHHIKHSEGGNPVAQIFEVFADGIAPKSKIQFKNAPHYLGSGTHYYGKGLSVEVSTKDEMSGIDELLHATNQSDYQTYTGEKAFDQEGTFDYRFYAVDKVGNIEKANIHNFTVDLTSPSTFHNVVGVAKGNIISTSTKMYLTFQDSISGVGQTYYKLDDGEYKLYKGGNIPFTYLPDGDHTLTYYSVDKVKNQETEKTFDFYLDKTAPIMSSDVIGDKFVVGDKVYFSGRTKLKLTAVDNKSGIKEVRYSIDGSEFKNYEDPFYLPSKSGEHIIRYYALDQMSNEGAGVRGTSVAEYRHNVSKVFVDLTGPVLSHKYTGKTFKKGDDLYINDQTQITIKGYDPESGLQYLSYRIDGQEKEVKFTENFTIPTSGAHTIDYFGYDNVNNRNVSQFKLIVDNTAPTIENTFSVKPIETAGDVSVYPAYVTLFLACSDDQSGYKKITYSINGATTRTYTQPITGFKKSTEYTIQIKAIDKLDNTEEFELKFKTADY
ncbi:MAG: OmpL47-type beta-barrel domain-containing protein [Flammeovirgaceae bacterium]